MTGENEQMYTGRCFCGAVEVRVTGQPKAMGLCHCTSCRHWSAAPVNAFTLWPAATVTVTRGADQLGAFSKTANSVRKWCRACGGHVLTEHPGWGLTDVYAAISAGVPVQGRGARELRRDRAAHVRRHPQAARPAQGDGWLGRGARRLIGPGSRVA